MDRLWAPWRIKYIQSKGAGGCIFCRAQKHQHQDYLVFKTKYSMVMLNIFPYNNGHLLVSPLRHISDISGLKESEALDLLRAVNKSKKLLDKTLGPEGYNIGLNLGKSSGAGITGHLHIHIVPRWQGDINFMPTLAATKIISQSLEELHRQLKDAYSKTN